MDAAVALVASSAAVMTITPSATRTTATAAAVVAHTTVGTTRSACFNRYAPDPARTTIVVATGGIVSPAVLVPPPPPAHDWYDCDSPFDVGIKLDFLAPTRPLCFLESNNDDAITSSDDDSIFIICREIEEASIWVGFGIYERHEKPSFVVFSCAEIF
jgi:hypothetical protein